MASGRTRIIDPAPAGAAPITVVLAMGVEQALGVAVQRLQCRNRWKASTSPAQPSPTIAQCMNGARQSGWRASHGIFNQRIPAPPRLYRQRIARAS